MCDAPRVVPGTSVDKGIIPPDLVDWLAKRVDHLRAHMLLDTKIFEKPAEPADLDLHYHDLVEKVQALSQERARDIVMFALGWQDGYRLSTPLWNPSRLKGAECDCGFQGRRGVGSRSG